MEMFFKLLRRLIIIPIALFVEWVVFLPIAFITFGLFRYIFENTTSNDYTSLYSIFYDIKDETDELVSSLFDIQCE